MSTKARMFFASQIENHPEREAIKDSMAIGIVGSFVRLHTKGTEHEEIANAALDRVFWAVAASNGLELKELLNLSKDTAIALTTAREIDERGEAK